MQRQFQYPSRDMNAVSSEEEAAMKCRTGFDSATQDTLVFQILPFF